MLKVFIIGYDEPYAVVGKYSFEDERFLYLDDAGKKIKIPHKRIAYIEDWEVFSETNKVEKAPTENGPAPITSTPESLRDALLQTPKEDLNKLGEQLKGFVSQKLEEQQYDALRVSQIEPEDRPTQFDGSEQIELLVVFTGAKEGRFTLSIPAVMFDKTYTPAIGRELFSTPEVQAFMSSDIMLDGLPVLKGNNIICKTKSSKTLGDVNVKMDVLGSMLAGKAGANLLNKHFKTSPFESGFSMARSPFETLPNILSEPKDETEE